MAAKHLRVLAAVALAATALGLTACSSGSQASTDGKSKAASSTSSSDMKSLIAAAKKEGSITLYGDATQDVMQKWTDAFTKKYGIKVTIVRNATGPLYQQFAQEESAGQAQADVISILDRSALDTAVKNGWIAKYTPQDGSKIDPNYSRAGYYYADQSITEPAIAYNTNNVTSAELAQLKADPMGFLAKQAKKGTVGIVAPQAGMQLQAFWYLYSNGPEAKKYGWNTLKGIASNSKLISDTVTVGQAVVQGEEDFGLPLADSYLTTLAAGGAPIGIVYPDPTVAVASALGIAANSKHPDAARLFAEWAASKDGVQTWTDVSQNAPTRSDVPFKPSYTSAPWYAPRPAKPWTAFTSDKTFLSAVASDGDYYDKWDSTFGYSG